jgi:hypothetical protein
MKLPKFSKCAFVEQLVPERTLPALSLICRWWWEKFYEDLQSCDS